MTFESVVGIVKRLGGCCLMLSMIGIYEPTPQLNTPIRPMIQVEIQGICEKSHSHMHGFATHSCVLLWLTSGLTIIGELQSVTKLLRHTLYSNRVT